MLKRIARATLLGIAPALAMMVMVTDARAIVITAYGWRVSEAASQSATPATLAAACPNGPGGPGCNAGNADVTYVANSTIDFDSRRSNTLDIGGWLASNPSLAAATITYHTALHGITKFSSMDPMLWQFTGTAFFANGSNNNIQHDDGVTLTVGSFPTGFVLTQPGPTPPTNTPFVFTGSTGNAPFDFIYGECCGGPQVFITDLIPPTEAPEPASLALLGTALIIGYGWLTRHRRNRL